MPESRKRRPASHPTIPRISIRQNCLALPPRGDSIAAALLSGRQRGCVLRHLKFTLCFIFRPLPWKEN